MARAVGETQNAALGTAIHTDDGDLFAKGLPDDFLLERFQALAGEDNLLDIDVHTVMLHGIDELQDSGWHAEQYVELDRVKRFEMALGHQGDVTYGHDVSTAVTGHHGNHVVQSRKQVDREQVGAAITGQNKAVAAEDVGEGAVFIDFAVVVVITAFEVAAGATGKADQAVSLIAL
ncbi:hypothetical protein ALP29_201280 [Pseudomonas syringae pv. avii]|uniref:Uncharacterized protein n=2 Tax=Pseudomonas syringae group TaxID=136849 RepID=A0A3M5U9I1_PSESX|nr:hypothetical protein ALQ30_200175 [Pseudomonas syringae pv. persicae]RMU42184.1 hypothetical protein ALP29_201280 [Pseudomonas syringae pv. avii]